MKDTTAITAFICLVLASSGVLGWPLTLAMSLLLAQSTNHAIDLLTKAEK